MQKVLLHSILVLSVFLVLGFSELPAGIYGDCYYYYEGDYVPACSVNLQLKRTSDGHIYTGNSKVNDPAEYVANNTAGVDVTIPAGYSYYVRGYKTNLSGPYVGLWSMDWAGPHDYLNENDNAHQDIILYKIGDPPRK